MTKSRFDSVLDMIGREAGATHRSIIEFLLASVLRASPGAHAFIRHRFSFTSELNSFSHERLTTRPCFEKEAKDYSEMASTSADSS